MGGRGLAWLGAAWRGEAGFIRRVLSDEERAGRSRSAIGGGTGVHPAKGAGEAIRWGDCCAGRVADGAAAMALPATAARGSLRWRPGRPGRRSPPPPIRPRLSPSRARGAFRWVAGEVGHAAATAVEAVDVALLWSWSSAR